MAETVRETLEKMAQYIVQTLQDIEMLPPSEVSRKTLPLRETLSPVEMLQRQLSDVENSLELVREYMREYPSEREDSMHNERRRLEQELVDLHARLDALS